MARLESASTPGRILVGEATAAHLAPAELDERVELTLEGVSRSVRAAYVAVSASYS